MNEERNRRPQDSEEFRYTYQAPTASERKMIDSIRRFYLPDEEKITKFDELLALDKKVKMPPLLVAITLGILGILILGLGMSMVLVWDVFIGGIVVALVGIVLSVIAYPVYKIMLRRGKERLGKRILKLTEELQQHNE